MGVVLGISCGLSSKVSNSILCGGYGECFKMSSAECFPGMLSIKTL